MKQVTRFCLCAAFLASFTQLAFAWGTVTGPNGGAAYRGPMGGAAVRGPAGNTAYRPPGGAYYGGGYRPYPAYPAAGVAAGVAAGAVVGSAAAASAYRPPAYYQPPVVVAPAPCGYYPYPPCY